MEIWTGTVLLVIAAMFFSPLGELIEVYKSKNPHYQKQELKRQAEHEQKKLAIRQRLKELVGVECLIKTNNLVLISAKISEIKGKIIDIDDQWLEVLVLRKKKKIKMILRTEEISSVSKIL